MLQIAIHERDVDPLLNDPAPILLHDLVKESSASFLTGVVKKTLW